jgi:hypothetical protein
VGAACAAALSQIRPLLPETERATGAACTTTRCTLRGCSIVLCKANGWRTFSTKAQVHHRTVQALLLLCARQAKQVLSAPICLPHSGAQDPVAWMRLHAGRPAAE